jgi:non-heme chloroperoxidase
MGLSQGGAVNSGRIAGDWQGILKASGAELRIIVRISEVDGGGWNAVMYSIDQSTDPIAVNSVVVDGPMLKLTVGLLQGTYEGEINADGTSIAGTWTQTRPVPLELQLATEESAWPIDSSPHDIRFVAVEDGVRLEVLDWGGSGRAIVLLAGLGNDAHVYDKFAPKLTPFYHVYGITRRGFGHSSAPDSGYSADRLGDDVIAVLNALGLSKPVLVGHSIAGEELSSVGSRYPERVAGLIYLDAAYGYAFYDPSLGHLDIQLVEVQRKLGRLQMGKGPADGRPLIRELLETDLPRLERNLREKRKDLDATPAALFAMREAAPLNAVAQAIVAGQQKYTNIPVPVLAIYAVPTNLGALVKDPAERAAFEARNEVTTEAQAKAFESGVPSARVLRLPNASHYIFASHEADVLREMNAFIEGLP